ncbi:MAG: helix-turn-helix domain-containing protein [Mucilaginibacter sp.]|nr:helix-turn-helix domain-containing protein [Mucilaginibacter sp.]
MNIHNGQTVKFIVYKNHYHIAELARNLNVTRKTVYNWFEDRYLKPAVILNIGSVLRHDFSVEFPHYFTSHDFAVLQTPLPNVDSQESEYYKNQYLKLLEKYNQLLLTMTGVKSLQLVK